MQFKVLFTLVSAASLVVASPFLGEDWINQQSAAGAAAAGDASSSGVASGMNTAAGAASAGNSASSGAVSGGRRHRGNRHGIFGREVEDLERRGWGGHRYGYNGYPYFGGYYPYYNGYYNDASSAAAAAAAASGGLGSSSSTSAATRRSIDGEEFERRELAAGEELELERRGWYGRQRYGCNGYPYYGGYYGGYYPYGGYGNQFGAAASAAAASGSGAATSVAA